MGTHGSNGDFCGGSWFRSKAVISSGSNIETFGGRDRLVADDRVVDISRQSEEFILPTYLEAYSPIADPQLLGDFVELFALPRIPADQDIVAFYARYGRLGDQGWMDTLSEADRRRLPEAARSGWREPAWFLREAATELSIYSALYWALCDSRIDVIRQILGKAPSTGQLVQVMIPAGEVKKPWVSPEEQKQRVTSFGYWEPSGADPGREFSLEECLHHARGLLWAQLNAREARAHRQWTHPRQLPQEASKRARGRAGRAEPNPLAGSRTVVFDSLLTAMYLQLSEAAEASRLLRRCGACQRFFYPDRPNQFYCRTRCSNAYRRRQFVQRRRQQGMGEEAPGAR